MAICMKRLSHLSDHMLDRCETYAAFIKAIEHKKHSKEVRELWLDEFSGLPDEEARKLKNQAMLLDPAKVDLFLTAIEDELSRNVWMHDDPRKKTMFCTSKAKGQKGKWRDLYCPCLKDHVIHHIIMRASERAFMRGMYKWCVGSVPKRGTAAAVKAVEKWCKSDRAWKYFVQIDIEKFFNNIRETDVLNCLKKRIKDEKIIDLHKQILESAPLPVPIGYFPSPWYANLVLEDLDHFILERMHKTRRGKCIKLVKHYVRYIDNLLIFGASKRDLEKVVHAVSDWLGVYRGLHIKPDWEIKQIAEYDSDEKMKKGTYRIDFIGYKFDRTRTILRDGNYLSTLRLAHRMDKRYKRKSEATLSDCQSLVSKTGFAACGDNATFTGLVNNRFSIENAKGVISNAAKMGVFRDP